MAARPDDRGNRHSGAARPAALGALPYPGGGGARRHLDSRRAGGDACRLAVGRAQGQPGAAFQQCRRRPCRKRLSRRRRARRDVLRLAHRPARPQEIVLHHADGLSARHRGDRDVVESVKLHAVPLCHRRRHRRRICRDQFHHPGADPGARARLERSRHQRQLLDRRGDGRARLACAARSEGDRPGNRLAARLPDRGESGVGDLLHAVLDSGKSALADDAWPRRGGAAGDRRHRGAL